MNNETKYYNNEIAIRAVNISKEYKMQERRRDLLKRVVLKDKNKKTNTITALDNVSFEIEKGDAIGIVGKNGSGKSTILQIVCGTLSPSAGKIEVNGKIAALLELGSGFNPEFTGRENIEINAILLGMTKKDIKMRIKDIIEFAEIGIFIDQPVRTYSSGMIVRLAFAIIAHANADIMVIDEALAVGDSYFTQKCMRYIQRFKQTGTLVFVSHDPNAVLSICNKAILIENGRIKYKGDAKETLEIYANEERVQQGEYIDTNNPSSLRVDRENYKTQIDKREYEVKWRDYRTEIINGSEYKNKIELLIYDEKDIQAETYGGEDATVIRTRLKNLGNEGKDLNVIIGGELVKLTIELTAKKDIKGLIVGFVLKNDKGLVVLGDNTFNKIESKEEESITSGEILSVDFVFTMPLLRAGQYSITSSIAEGSIDTHKILHWKNDSILIESQCTSIAAGVAGVPMQSISIRR